MSQSQLFAGICFHVQMDGDNYERAKEIRAILQVSPVTPYHSRRKERRLTFPFLRITELDTPLIQVTLGAR